MCTALWRASWVPGQVARGWCWHQAEGGRVPCPVPPDRKKVARQQLTQGQKKRRKYLRGARREERPEIKKKKKKVTLSKFMALHY